MIKKILKETFKDCDYIYAFRSCSSEPKRVAQDYLVSNIKNIICTLDYVLQTTKANEEEVIPKFEKFIFNYKVKMDKIASINSRVASPLIQGTANFPFARMEKLLDRARTAQQDLDKFVDKFKKDMIKKYTVIDTSVIVDNLIADYHKMIKLGCDKKLAASSLRGKLITQAKKGLATEVKNAIVDCKIFTARNKIHKVIDDILAK